MDFGRPRFVGVGWVVILEYLCIRSELNAHVVEVRRGFSGYDAVGAHLHRDSVLPWESVEALHGMFC